jgi:hypothetical protein
MIISFFKILTQNHEISGHLIQYRLISAGEKKFKPVPAPKITLFPNAFALPHIYPKLVNF